LALEAKSNLDFNRRDPAEALPWREGTAQLVMSPLEFMQWLAALVPRPRLHLIRFHGVLAPNAEQRAQVDPAREGRWRCQCR
jgi:hypothetical protein